MGSSTPTYDSDKTKSISGRSFKFNLLKYLALVIILFSVSYSLSSYRYANITYGNTTVVTKSTRNNSWHTKTQHSHKSIGLKIQHRGKEHGMPKEKVKSKNFYHFPPCDIKYSEYTPCEDPKRLLKFSRDRLIYRERHCPEKNELLRCSIPAPFGYKKPFQWPQSRDYAWFANVPHKHLTVEKAGQNWIRYEAKKDRFRFPGGGTMFPNGADKYIDGIGNLINLKDGSIRTAIDTGCGVASLGAYLFSRSILTMSFAPRDTSHEAQVQFALERGVPALIGILASIRLPYPSRAFDMAHCSRCLIPWGKNDGQYLLEVDRILRPGGYWILSGPPINWRKHHKGWKRTRQDLNSEQSEIEAIAKSLCWEKFDESGDISVWRKPLNHIQCMSDRKVIRNPAFCQAQDPDKAWYTKLQTCLTPLPHVSNATYAAGGKLENWPERLTATPPRISSGSANGITEKMFKDDAHLWNKRITYYKTINNELKLNGRYRNLLDMNAHLGGFAASLADYPLWVMNVVPNGAKINTLGIIYERGLIGTYQNWCEAMSTYPRTYDLIHADSVLSFYKDRCAMEDILLEMDRILRPEGNVIIRDDVDVLLKAKSFADALRWDTQLLDHEDGAHIREKILFGLKMYWTAPPDEEVGHIKLPN
ncbi:hypothetical protein MKW98_012117 [Papaver atlanticum]|uniref:Methyltransferase n=1 Tax=Papaver atlanticum TaxID=357466 RepID=A0AAD4THJ8_9MAGN|nr:hypothetical protein MKW98_012117 [Papaver atlanticum]